MCVLPTSWVVYFLAGLTFLLTWLFFALLNITSPILAHHHHDIIKTRAAILIIVTKYHNHMQIPFCLSTRPFLVISIKAILTTMITMATLKPRCWPRCCSSLTSQDGLEQSLGGSLLAFSSRSLPSSLEGGRSPIKFFS